MSKYVFGKVSSEELKRINPLLQTLAYKTIEKSSVDFGILRLGGFRTAEEQNELYKQGYSLLDGFKKIGAHQRGMAVDFVPFIDGKFTWNDVKAFREIHTAAEEAWLSMDVNQFNLIWGGDWRVFLDMPHYELRRV